MAQTISANIDPAQLAMLSGGQPQAPDFATQIARIVGGGASLYDAFGTGGTTDMGVARTAAAMADPFASQRPAYQEQLLSLLKDPSSLREDPGYKFGLNQGMDAIKGAGNAIYGGTRAGAIYPELAQYATGYADKYLNDRLGMLMKAAGVGEGSPGTAGLLYERGGENVNRSTGTGINDIISGLFGGQNGGIAGGIMGLIAKYLTPGAAGGSGPGAPSGTPFGMGDRGIGPLPYSAITPNSPGLSYFPTPNANDPSSFGDPGGLNQNLTPTPDPYSFGDPGAWAQPPTYGFEPPELSGQLGSGGINFGDINWDELFGSM